MPRAGKAPGSRSVAELEDEVSSLRKELARTRMERDILKSGGVLCQGIAAGYAFMKVWRGQYPVPLMAQTLEVSRAGFHAWLKRPPSQRAQEDGRLKVAVLAAHRKARETYGTRRLLKDLREDGWRPGRDRLARLRKELGIRCRQQRRFRVTTDSQHERPAASNLLEQQFTAGRPDELWHGDITCISTAESGLYLAALKDPYTREIAGYAMGPRMTQGWVTAALQMALWRRRPVPGLIHHSDCGSQYCAKDYQALLKKHGVQISMSRKGNCYDNAPIESCWGSLKNGMVHHRPFATRADAGAAIREYIEIFHNRQRRHSRPGYLAPAVFAQSYWKSAA